MTGSKIKVTAIDTEVKKDKVISVLELLLSFIHDDANTEANSQHPITISIRTGIYELVRESQDIVMGIWDSYWETEVELKKLREQLGVE